MLPKKKAAVMINLPYASLTISSVQVFKYRWSLVLESLHPENLKESEVLETITPDVLIRGLCLTPRLHAPWYGSGVPHVL